MAERTKSYGREKLDWTTEANQKSEYRQMQQDVQVHNRKARALDKARREVKFTNVLTDETPQTATEFSE